MLLGALCETGDFAEQLSLFLAVTVAEKRRTAIADVFLRATTAVPYLW